MKPSFLISIYIPNKQAKDFIYFSTLPSSSKIGEKLFSQPLKKESLHPC